MKRRYHIGEESFAHIDYKDADFLRKFLNSQAKIYPPKRYGVDAYTQRALTRAIKRARSMGLLPYTVK